jgi:hypothetical protein
MAIDVTRPIISEWRTALTSLYSPLPKIIGQQVTIGRRPPDS